MAGEGEPGRDGGKERERGAAGAEGRSVSEGLGAWSPEPLSRQFGADRGTPIDRYFIDRFLADHAGDIRGRVLEFGDNLYTLKHGGRQVTRSDVLYPRPGKPGVTIVGDLATGRRIPAGAFDCIVCTQTLQYLLDIPGAIRVLHRSLRPGGVLLATVPGIAQLDSGGARQGWIDYWRPTRHAVARLFGDAFGVRRVAVTARGNAWLASAFLMGLTVRELPPAAFEHRDEDYDVSIAVRAVRAGPRRPPAGPAPGPGTAAPARSARFRLTAGRGAAGRSAATRAVTAALALGPPLVAALAASPAPVVRAAGRLWADEWGSILDVEARLSGRDWGSPSSVRDVVRRAAVHAAGPYYCGACRVEAVAVASAAAGSPAFTGATRGPVEAVERHQGLVEAALLHEGLVEALARARGDDGLELRRRNALRYGLPTAAGQWLTSSAGLGPCLDAIGPAYARLRADAARGASRPGRRHRRGVGVACIAVGIGRPFVDGAASARLVLGGDGRLTLLTDVPDALGRRVLARIAADTLELPRARVAAPAPVGLVHAPGDDPVFGPGRAVWLAARDLERRLRQAAGAPPGARLGWTGNGPRFRHDGREWPVTPRGGDRTIEGAGRFASPTTGPDRHGRGTPYPVYGFAAAVVALDIDPATARVEVREVAIAADVGRALAPAAMRARLRARVLLALARALGHVPHRAPAIAGCWVEDPEPRGGLGVKWLGDGAELAVVPALANAVRDALGRPLGRLPVTPDGVAALLRGRPRGPGVAVGESPGQPPRAPGPSAS